MSTNEKTWITPNEFEFGIKKSTQTKKRSAGKLPYTKFGGFVLYNRDTIYKLFEDHHRDIVS